MYPLIQHMIGFKYACKINHWSTDSYEQHILFDRLAEDIDTWVDKIAECYFMAGDEKNIFQPDILNPKLISSNLPKMCMSIINHLEGLQSNKDLHEGIKSLLGTIEEGFLAKLALAKLV